MKKNTKNAFTLVEMILVTVIIGIVAGIVINVINIPRVQARSRDSKRIGDLKRIQTALELYFADKRAYPVNAGFSLANTVLTGTNLIAPSYMDQIPLDPNNGKNAKNTSTMKCRSGSTTHGYYYITDANGTKYVISAIMELVIPPENINNKCSNIPNCISGVACGSDASNAFCYCVQNPM